MRLRFAGLIVVLLATTALAQVEGEVESVGLQGMFRPDCWTPMVVRLRSTIPDSTTYQLRVIQEDLDRDRVLYWRPVALKGAPEGRGATPERFWMYFIPQPTRNGLPETGRPNASLADLQKALRVVLCSEGGKEILTLPLTSTITSLDPPPSPWIPIRGSKCIVCVTEAASPPSTEYASAIGLLENVVFVTLQPHQLPESVLGYDAVDAIVWLGADASTTMVRQDKLPAIEQYVRQGGKLVVTQMAEWQRTHSLREMLPVTVSEVEDVPDLAVLKSMAKAGGLPNDPWNKAQGPFRAARAAAKPGALVEEWIEWKKEGEENPDRTPYLARWGYGLGSVTWLAQDLSVPAILGRGRGGWPFVWDRVFDWRNATMLATPRTPDKEIAPYKPSDNAWDVGASMLKGMEHGARSAGLVLLAVGFFVVYWLVAGPGLFVFLSGRQKAQLSWFAFGLSALVATGLTVVLVKLVLRGPPQVQHVTLVRQAPGQPAHVYSRLGLYIPRDGEQKLELKETDEKALSFITPFAIHPQQVKSENEFPAYLEYQIPVRSTQLGEAATVTIPYRSTLKKLQAKWVGNLERRIEGSAKLVSGGGRELEGLLTNATGYELRDVYLVYNSPASPNAGKDRVYYLPKWGNGVSLNLEKELARRDFLPIGPEQHEAAPGQDKLVRGVIEREDKPFDTKRAGDEGWLGYWYLPLHTPAPVGSDRFFDDASDGYRRSFPVLSLFDRLPPARELGNSAPRFELLRRGARRLDVSAAVAAGQLVVLAQADGPLPYRFEVEGDRVAGEGRILYQCVLPLDRSAVEKQPAEKD